MTAFAHANLPASAIAEGLPLHTARVAALKVLRALAGTVTRAKVCGSVRREKDWVRDLDIVVCPKRAESLWGDKTSFWHDDFLNRIANGGSAPGGTGLSGGRPVSADAPEKHHPRHSSSPSPTPQAPRPSPPLWSVAGTLRPDSLQITLRSLRNSTFKVELWTCLPDFFGWMCMIRTGPKELGPALMRCARARGFEPKVQCCLIPGVAGDKPIPMPTEHAVCQALGVGWRSPRGEERLTLAQQMHAIADAARVPDELSASPEGDAS